MHRLISRQLAALTLAVGSASLVGGCANYSKAPTLPADAVATADNFLIAIGDAQWGTFLEVDDARKNPTVRFGYNQVGVCVRGRLKAEIELTPNELVITPQPNLDTCPKFRWRVKLDGSGGREQLWQDNRWVTAASRREMRIVQN